MLQIRKSIYNVKIDKEKRAAKPRNSGIWRTSLEESALRVEVILPGKQDWIVGRVRQISTVFHKPESTI